MLILKPNRVNLFIRCLILLSPLAWGQPLFTALRNNPAATADHTIFLVFIPLVIFMIIDMISVFGITKVTVDKNTDTITFISWIRKQTISTKDIENYYATFHINKSTGFLGILVNAKDGKTYQLAGQNLISVADFKQYLIDKGIDYAGERKMTFPFN